MHIKKILILFIAILSLQSAQAQEKQSSLGILKLNAPDMAEHKAIKINKYVEAAFYKSRRFNIVTRQLLDAIDQEREQQKENIDKLVIQQGKAIGADYVVKGYATTYKSSIYKSSPKSRAPYQPRARTTTSNTTTSPRKKTKETTSIKSKKKSSKPQTLKSTAPKRTTDASKGNSPRGTSSTQSTSPESSKGKTSPVDQPKTSPYNGSTSSTSKAKKSTTPAPPSGEIDQVYTSTQINFTIKIIDVKTGVIVTEETYKGSINGIAVFVQKIVQETFPYEFRILEIMEMKGSKKAKHILVDGGTVHGLTQGRFLKAYEMSEEEVDGKILKREIMVGQLYVKKVDTGGHFSLCTIYRGKKEILAKMNAGVELILK